MSLLDEFLPLVTPPTEHELVGKVLEYEGQRYRVKLVINRTVELRKYGVARPHRLFGCLDETKTKLQVVFRDLECHCKHEIDVGKTTKEEVYR